MRKSLAAFMEVTASDAASYRWAMLTFFGGMLIIAILDKASCCSGGAREVL